MYAAIFNSIIYHTHTIHYISYLIPIFISYMSQLVVVVVVVVGFVKFLFSSVLIINYNANNNRIKWKTCCFPCSLARRFIRAFQQLISRKMRKKNVISKQLPLHYFQFYLFRHSWLFVNVSLQMICLQIANQITNWWNRISIFVSQHAKQIIQLNISKR